MFDCINVGTLNLLREVDQPLEAPEHMEHGLESVNVFGFYNGVKFSRIV